ncbi:acyl-CoA thioester hydrolase/BAAT C-terminal domain-containing protein [Kribbella sp. VKM Ac-2566]|uniref:acyl-CoA thioester hydrolase/BAAT C-terminal domain-containing protein n=1 Tax=Kribbella sp. VKM Ac-2566 TaxID=2512218 RepID=UPI0010EC191C|nr:acyl-CoA thioester hydrolase/BAAT C-terminal domain-containing protein [Kribbella sp. VKM Ac-2566]TDW89019.1 bile acid acyltransferase/acyl-CoA thioester hydrolase-like protein [Kribbella sp. VKM Ac-2566]
MSTGVLLLHGSSGTPDLDRARLLEAEGYDVLAPRWNVTHEVPLESFPLAELAHHDRLVVMGSSWGAEAALLLGALDERVDAVVAFAPSAYVWGRNLEDGSQRSAWTWQVEPLPFVPLDLDWKSEDDPPSYTGLYRQSLRRAPEQARIPVERINQVLLIAGGDDKVWPAVEFAEEIARRRAEQATRIVMVPDAGHRAVLPGEEPKTAGQRMARGGTEAADRKLGTRAWPEILELLGA